jgi:hypothetical protein
VSQVGGKCPQDAKRGDRKRDFPCTRHNAALLVRLFTSDKIYYVKFVLYEDKLQSVLSRGKKNVTPRLTKSVNPLLCKNFHSLYQFNNLLHHEFFQQLPFFRRCLGRITPYAAKPVLTFLPH